MDGVILLNKPGGITSFSAVKKACRILHEKKGGHTGTLDPDACGLMIVLLGKYTKLVPFAVKDHKAYHAEFSLGRRTDTQDASGNVIESKEPSSHSEEEMQKAADTMTGKILQIPPMYSAVHVNGKKLYEYASKGMEVERKPREAVVEKLEVHKVDNIHWQMNAVVSSGTYIRTLIEDLCRKIGELGAMDHLVRTAIGTLSLQDAQNFDELEKNPHFLNPLSVLSNEWPAIEIQNDADILNGRAVKLPDAPDQVILIKEGRLLAAYQKKEDGFHHCVRGLW